MNDQVKYKVDGKIITNGESLGVRGIDMPISGSLSGVGIGGLNNQYTLDERGMRNDVVRRHVTTSDLTEQIRELGVLQPSYSFGKHQ